MKATSAFKCPSCSPVTCSKEEKEEYPDNCPIPESEQELEDARSIYQNDPDIEQLAVTASKVEAEGYCKWTRIEEIIQFARRLDVTTIGIAHCIGLKKEAGFAHRIFEAAGFTVNSVCCKTGSMNKEELGIDDSEKVRPGEYETACNPIGQAKILDKAGCQLNVVIGLCVGHDSLFFMHSKAPATVLIAKDRVLGHNPAASLYTSHSYYKRLKK